MAKNKSQGKLAVGTRIRAKAGVTAPEFPDVSCAGWTGSIVELSGKKSDPKYIVEWEEATVASMPAEYRRECEAQGLFYRMAQFEGADIEPCDE
jgi:hypothetical protein